MPPATTSVDETHSAAVLAATPVQGAGTGIVVDKITKTFPGAGAVKTAVAVDNISLRVEPGELFFLLGPSGCGKTTLLRMIAGFIEPTAGNISFVENGVTRDVTFTAPNKRNIGMVFQSYALWPHMTVADNVAFGLEVRKVGADERKRRVAEALAAVRMETYGDRKPTQLSGGQQQRVALARALVIRPSVLLLDEPLSNLDAKLRIELRSEIRRVCKETGITTVYVTHDQKEALSMADRVAILRDGHVVQVGTPEDLYRRPGTRFVAEFLGETNFIAATVVGIFPDGVDVETPAGRLRARPPLPNLNGRPGALGDQVLLSIRPEAISIASMPGPNTIRAKIVETTYLGDLAQHALDLGGGIRVKMAILNPGQIRKSLGPAGMIEVTSEDVVMLPAESK